MSTTYLSVDYFPFKVNFFDKDAVELAEAKYGIRVDGAICKLLCKIFKEGYYIPWGEEQSLIFARKLGGELSGKQMNDVIEILVAKGFFNEGSYRAFGILTSEEIQQVWLEATSRRKRNLEELPFLLIDKEKKKQEKDKKGEQSVDNSTENADNSEQSKEKHSKAEESIAGSEGEDSASPALVIPDYAQNTQTHNVTGLLNNLFNLGVNNRKELDAILKLSDYGRKNTQVWLTLASTKWTKIENPGRYLISVLRPH